MARIRTVFGDRLGLDVPVSGCSHSVAVTAASSRAGGISVYGLAHDPHDQVGPKLEAIRALATQVPIATNIMMPKGMPEDQGLRHAQKGPSVAWTRGLRPVEDVVDALTAHTRVALDAAASIAQQSETAR